MRVTSVLAIVVTGCVWFGAVGHAATDPADACKDTKARAAGRKASDLITAFGKNFKRPNPARLSFSISKAQSKLTRQFSKAESKGGCATIDDAAAIEAKVEALVSDVVGDVSPACDCCAVADELSFTATTPSASCGVLRNFRCTNDVNAACVTDGDCDFGSCIDFPGFCSDNFSATCSGDGTPCTGTCNELVARNLPLDLECGGLYLGGGGNAVPLPLPLSDTATFIADVASCNSGTGGIVLGPTTAVETGSDRTCTGIGCPFGAPMPIVNSGTPATSLCAIARLSQDASGVGTCDGVMSLDLSVEMDVHLTGDLLSSPWLPDVPGIQPCPLCVRQCGGGTNDRFPCTDDTDCAGGGTCGAATQCLGGSDDGDLCAPGTTALGEEFPTSHDCRPPVGSLFMEPVAFAMTLATTPVTVNGRDLGTGTGAQRVLAGFCRDNFNVGSLCFEGDSGSCPSGASTPVACQSDVDCDDGDEYESCAQRTGGAFSEAAATQLTVTGAAPGTCLANGLPAAATLVSAPYVPPTFDSTIDAAFDLPGPGALGVQGELTLVP